MALFAPRARRPMPRPGSEAPPRARPDAPLTRPDGLPPDVSAALASRPAATMFRSAAWLQACVATWQGHAHWRLIETRVAGEPAWSLVASRIVLRHGVLPIRILALNQAIDERLDRPWIERNGFFGAGAQAFGEHFEALLERLRAEPGWDELRVPGLADADALHASRAAEAAGLSVRTTIDVPSFEVDLAAVRTLHGGDYLAALSANTRQQLRRSRRLAERTLGPLRLERADGLEEALRWLEATGPLHRARWPGTAAAVSPSGFAEAEFVAFHRRLISTAFDRGSIDYLRLRAGDRLLAYLYNFVCGDRVEFYLSGVDHTVDAALRPGLLAHWLAIERAVAEGRSSYDFLAGDARYKRSLSIAAGRMRWLVLQRPRLRLRLEARAGRARAAIRSRRPSGAAGPEAATD